MLKLTKVRAGIYAAISIIVLLLISACSNLPDFPAASNPVHSTPWPNFELLRYDIFDQTGMQQGTVDFEVNRREGEYEFRVLFLLPKEDVRDETILNVDTETLKPLRYLRQARSKSEKIEISGQYEINDKGETILNGTVNENGVQTKATLPVGDFAFDTESSAWLWRTIDFQQDYEVSYRSVNIQMARTQLVHLRVMGQDLLRVPAGDFLSWQLEARPGLDRQNIWYSIDHPHVLVRWDLEPRQYLLREINTQRPSANQ